MNLTSPSDVRRLLDEIGVRPSRARGQNFLIDRNIRDILIGAASAGAGDEVLEVGPGLGVLTEPLGERARRLVAVEKDRRLYEFLCRRWQGRPGVELVHADMLDLDVAALFPARLDALVSNLPYSAGSRILVHLVRSARPPARMVVTVQYEVGERLTAAPGGREYGLLSVWVQRDYTVERLRTLSASCFWPRPEVRSMAVRLTRRDVEPAPLREARCFDALTRHAFAHRRKQMAAILGRAAGGPRLPPDGLRAALEGAGLAETARPEELAPEDWRRLAKVLTTMGAGSDHLWFQDGAGGER